MINHKWSQQQDAADFLCYILPLLAWCFFTGPWLPKWAATQYGDDASMDDIDEKGEGFAPIMISICLPVPDYTLQDFVSLWHGTNGHQRTLIDFPKGTCFHLDRVRTSPQRYTDTTEVFITEFVCMPCLISGNIRWVSYKVVAVTYHMGPHFTSGHWRTSVWQGGGWHRWLHYDDAIIPEVGTSLPLSVHQNWTMVRWYGLRLIRNMIDTWTHLCM